jgi:hypothetical protein
LVNLETGSHILPKLAWNPGWPVLWSSYFYYYRDDRCRQLFLLRWGLANFFILAGLNVILPISAFCTAGMTSTHHCIQLLVKTHLLSSLLRLVLNHYPPDLK